MSEDRDYTKYSFRITFLVIAMMLVISLVPPFSIGNIHFRRANILSDIITFSDDTAEREGELTELDRHFLEEAERLGYLEPDETDTTGHEPVLENSWDIGGAGDGGQEGGNVPEDLDALQASGQKIFRFRDYTPEGRLSVADFSLMMQDASKKRVVRIAFLGDSYVEGDIITGDIREQLQELYGGQGVGFVPFGNPLAISRPTVTHTFDGWKNYNLIYKKNVPEQYQDKFFVSGTISVPQKEEAVSHYKGARFRKHIASWSRARLVFINEGSSVIDVVVNDSIRKQFTPDASGQVQQISLSGSGMQSLEVKVSQPEGFIGYGVALDGARGVAVDNYAIRSNSGIAFFGTDRQINSQIGRMLGYDLIVLQWGLNAMSADVTDYGWYGKSLKRVINYVKTCFPQSAIVVMGVGDRCTQRDGQFVTMDAVKAMIAVQKAAAEECGVAFWDTFEAMGGPGSIAGFVEKQWAAKDYTHLSYGGGRYIATRFVQALLDAKNGKTTGDGDFAGDDAAGGDAVELDLSSASEDAAVQGDEQENAQDSAAVIENAHDFTRVIENEQDSTGAIEDIQVVRDSVNVDTEEAAAGGEGEVEVEETGKEDKAGDDSQDSSEDGAALI